MITYIRTVDKWKINPTPQTLPFGRLKKPNILAIVVIFDVDNLCVFVRILSTQPAVYQHKSVDNAIFVATKKKKSNIFFVALALRFRI